MAEPLSLLPIRSSEIAVGKPLEQTVYDWHGNVMLESGTVIQSEKQMEEILAGGFFQDTTWDLTPRAMPVKTSPEKTAAEKISPQKAPIEKANTEKKLVEGVTPEKTAGVNPRAADSSESKLPSVGKEIVETMEEVHWRIGEALQLQPHDNPNIRYAVHLIGFMRNRSVFLTAPALDGKFVLIRDGQTFVVRAFSGKKAYAFTAAAMKSMHSPHPYLMLSYPKEVRCTIVRQSARIDVKMIASVSLGKPERTNGATLIDLSVGGTSAIVKEPLGIKGEEGRLKFKVHVAEVDAYLNLPVVLRSVSKLDSGDAYRHGFEFVDVPDTERLALSAFVHQTLAENG